MFRKLRRFRGAATLVARHWPEARWYSLLSRPTRRPASRNTSSLSIRNADTVSREAAVDAANGECKRSEGTKTSYLHDDLPPDVDLTLGPAPRRTGKGRPPPPQSVLAARTPRLASGAKRQANDARGGCDDSNKTARRGAARSAAGGRGYEQRFANGRVLTSIVTSATPRTHPRCSRATCTR